MAALLAGRLAAEAEDAVAGDDEEEEEEEEEVFSGDEEEVGETTRERAACRAGRPGL